MPTYQYCPKCNKTYERDQGYKEKCDICGEPLIFKAD